MNQGMKLKISKAAKIVGKTLSFRNASIEDAAFILSLRTDANKSRFLSSVSPDVIEQEKYLMEYQKNDDQAYFIIEYQDQIIGTVRLYDANGDSFCWGSWILKDNSPNHAAIESALMVYAYATDFLGFKSAHFDVRKENIKVWKFHERFGAKRINETKIDYFYCLSSESIVISRNRYKKFLSDPIQVEFIK